MEIMEEASCYHMFFLGNPGTRKTTLARILGRVFKEIVILEKGEVHEASREDHIGKFMGQTAPKVRENKICLVDLKRKVFPSFVRRILKLFSINT